MMRPNDPSADLASLWSILRTQDARAQEMRNLLVRLETTMEHLAAAVESIRGPSGLPRCAERGQRLAQAEKRLEEVARLSGAAGPCIEQRERLEHLEEKFQALCSRLWWFGATVTAAVIGLALRTGWELLVR